jgi:predicted cobalt transporter CbtA
MWPFVRRGIAAGLAGGVASVLVLVLVGESSINRAIELEEARAVAGEAHEELFSRSTQVIGGAVGLLVSGACLGLLFGIVYAATRHRLGTGAEWRRARRLGAVAFVAIVLVPFLKYPANPPAVGDPDTVNQRTIAYVSMIVISVLTVLLAAAVLERLRGRGLAEERAQPLAVLAGLAVVGVAFAALPPNPDQITVPADLLWSFRMASLGGQAAFWAVTATAFGLLTVRAAARPDASGTAGDPKSTGSMSPLA